MECFDSPNMGETVFSCWDPVGVEVQTGPMLEAVIIEAPGILTLESNDVV